MSRVIKCPICSRTAKMTYRENRVYRSECFNIGCKETVTVTAPSGKAAEELFSKFEKGTIHPKLSIPKKIAEELDDKNSTLNNFNWQFFMQNHRQSFWSYSNELNEYAKDIHNYEAICAYLNPVTKLFVEVEG
ncbi:hypothetical protein [Lactococcus formosensis]|uniref:hypothetical protein n=1 Tax=Lactococcus formosensis TaxID=1281486 RepID=UPI002434FC90|nr:hypothetical protein [Lactococcus formosensis]MDG6130815.1 hypothetical protein [Lactococcus formosensis]